MSNIFQVKRIQKKIVIEIEIHYIKCIMIASKSILELLFKEFGKVNKLFST